MRTTLNLADHLVIEAKRLAAARRTTLTRILEDSLRSYLAEARRSASNRDALAPLPVVTDARIVPGIDLNDTSALWDER